VSAPATERAPLLAAATLLGVGLGGFADGILFHQILQLHGMLSAVLPRTSLVDAEINMFWDGLFHAFTWLATLGGVALLWRAVGRPGVPHSTRLLLGGMLLGWGLFNVVEGVIDHGILGLHHVVENGNHGLWDGAFLAFGALLIALGASLARASEERVHGAAPARF
jgi:uncharacterized membrane protein